MRWRDRLWDKLEFPVLLIIGLPSTVFFVGGWLWGWKLLLGL